MDGRQIGHYVPGANMQEYGPVVRKMQENNPPPQRPGGYGAIAWVRSAGSYGYSWNQESAAEAGQVALRQAGPSRGRTRGGWHTGWRLSPPDAVVLCWEHEGILVLSKAPDGRIGYTSYQRGIHPSGWPLQDYPGGRVVLQVDTRYGATFDVSLESQLANEQQVAARQQTMRDRRKAAGLDEIREW
jgi:hypothetical protein